MTIKNSAAKEEILKRISTAQKQAGLPDHVEVPREYQHEGTLNDDELRDMLVDRLEEEIRTRAGAIVRTWVFSVSFSPLVAFSTTSDSR